MKIAYVVGARPNFVKMAPVIAQLRLRMPSATHVVIHTGQHYDREMSEIFLEELGVPTPDHLLGVGSGSHAVQTARIMERLEPILMTLAPELVVVPGDVNSTLAATLVAAKLELRIAHIESGLRSFDRSMPEEINRIVTDDFSEYLFVHSEEAISNLRAEGISNGRIHFVGNTMIDSLVATEQRFRTADTVSRLGLTRDDYLLVTLHRPSLVDGPLLPAVLDHLATVAKTLPVIFPVHPRTRKMLEGQISETGLLMTDPLGYVDFLCLESAAAGVLTDSGGVQEETTYLGVPCFTLRRVTERPVTVRVGTNHILGLDPASIQTIVPALANRAEPPPPPPLWDGHAAERAAEILLSPA